MLPSAAVSRRLQQQARKVCVRTEARNVWLEDGKQHETHKLTKAVATVAQPDFPIYKQRCTFNKHKLKGMDMKEHATVRPTIDSSTEPRHVQNGRERNRYKQPQKRQ